MDQLKVKAELDRWLIEFVEANNPQLEDWAPCPYAKAARLSGMISTKFCEVSELYDVVRESIETLEHKDVVVVCFDHHMINPVELQEVVFGMNKMLMPINYVILEDHPDAPEYVNGVKMNFGLCGLLVLQKLSKLNTASDKLCSQGYYNTWDKKSLDEVVNWRYE